MLATSRRIAAEQWPARMLLTVHDGLVFEASPAVADEIGVALKHEMERVHELSVSLEVDERLTWADARLRMCNMLK
jgi:DNA polymerase I